MNTEATPKPNAKTLQIVKGYGFDTAKYLCHWKNYVVFAPSFHDPNEVAYIGMPIYVLQHANKAREAADYEIDAMMKTLK